MGWQEKLQKIKEAYLTQPQHFGNFKRFSKQSDALQCLADQPNLRVFSYEYLEQQPGIRKFIVSDLETFWGRYQMETKRHFYETIPEGCTCRLYFDLEFEFDLNPTVDPQEMMSEFRTVLANDYLDRFGVRPRLVELDSTTSTKFSRHLIVHGIVFESNAHCGSYVQQLLRHLPPSLTVNTKTGSSVFIDLGVYTKNRQFRIALSTKMSKNAPLLDISNPHQTLEWFESTLVVCPGKIHISMPTISKIGQPRIASYRPSQGSQHPDIDHFVLEIIQRHDPRAYIKSTMFFQDSDTIVYQPINYRYCQNIQRDHKSNGVYFVVNLKTREMVQKCHDPDCKFFQSLAMALPEEDPWEIDDHLVLEMVHQNMTTLTGTLN
ncbi:hypothetical protein EDD86DRAFT_247250 [Gorgonomyces haynaldii]|nr:hypothetical protein EDD86DRAFT_247250 [Gorgonomyces haynaldii]